ncbi:MAG: peptidylprolyl isomerase [Desulfobacterales bacterium]|nr:peptidylprolyl isomerase [Desulfobacterales bacterium]
MKKIFKEPLIYFFVLGFVVFGLHSFLNRVNQDETDPFTVEVTSADVEWIRSSWEARMKRKPTQQEFQGLINRYIRDEIFQREALTMDLDNRDLVIQRRLVQKLTFVLEDINESIEPTDDELIKYMQKNQEKYRIPEMISFSQVYFNPEKRKDSFDDAKKVLDRLKSSKSPPEKASSLGDTIMVDYSYKERSPAEVVRVLGKKFADELFSASEMGWQGPITSTFGVHLIYIEKRIASKMSEFASLREGVKNDFMYERKKQVIDSAYNAMKSRYTILLEGLPYE